MKTEVNCYLITLHEVLLKVNIDNTVILTFLFLSFECFISVKNSLLLVLFIQLLYSEGRRMSTYLGDLDSWKCIQIYIYIKLICLQDSWCCFLIQRSTNHFELFILKAYISFCVGTLGGWNKIVFQWLNYISFHHNCTNVWCAETDSSKLSSCVFRK
jgi:hypothetical protein